MQNLGELLENLSASVRLSIGVVPSQHADFWDGRRLVAQTTAAMGDALRIICSLSTTTFAGKLKRARFW